MAKSQPNTVRIVCDKNTPRPIHPEEIEMLLNNDSFVKLVLEHQDSKPQAESDASRTLRQG